MSKKKIMYKVYVSQGTIPCTVQSKGDILSFLEDPQVGDKLCVEIIEMTKEEFLDLPEWEGP
jgi:hypothetical protein